MRVAVCGIALLVCCSDQAAAQEEEALGCIYDPQATLALAEAAFQEGVKGREDPGRARGHFAESARRLAELYRDGLGDARSLLQQGNAELLADLLPQAILSYQRGLRLAPNDWALRENLDYARSLVSLPPPGDRGRPPLDSWPPGLPRPTAGLLLALAWIGYAATLAAGTRWFMSQRQAWLVRAILSGLFTLALGAAWLWQLDTERWPEQQPLVVIAADAVPFYRGNSDSYPRHPDLPTLSRGMEARRLTQRGDWLQVQFASGAIGWVPGPQVLVDEP